MPADPNEDMRVAIRLGSGAEIIGTIRAKLNGEFEGAVFKAIQADRIERSITEKLTRLENAEADTFKRTQGEIAGLRTALAHLSTK